MTEIEWDIGGVRIYQIIELEAGPLIQSIIPDATQADIRNLPNLSPDFADEQGNLRAVVQSFLIMTSKHTILLDSGIGNNKNRTDVPEWSYLQTNFLAKLRSLGVKPTDIDHVICTHLHMDHVGWNTTLDDGKWIPTFPNATYIFIRDEYNYWKEKPEKEIADDHAAFQDSVQPIVDAHLAKLVDMDFRVAPEIRFISTPGHTPAHASVLVEGEKQRALFSGDLLHHPCQILKPDWSTIADTFPELAASSRKKIFSDIADTNTVLLGSHFSGPAGLWIGSTQNGWTFRTS